MKVIFATTLLLLAGCTAATPQTHADPVPTPAHAAPQPLQQILDAALARALPSVVRVTCSDGNVLSGTVISHDGLILTCAHIPAAVGDPVEIVLPDGRRFPAVISNKLPAAGESNLGRDLAIAKITQTVMLPAAQLAARTPDDPAALLIAAGFPDTLLYGEDRVTDPLYIRLGRSVTDPYPANPGQLTTSIFGAGGDSGGSLFDLSGRLIGVVHGGDGSGAHMQYTRIQVLHENWHRLAPNQPRPAAIEGAPAATTPLAPATPAPGAPAVVEVCSKSRWVALGCIIADGWVLTKASDLGPNLTVRTNDDFVAIAEVAATDPQRDLALLKIPFAPEVVRLDRPIQWDAAHARPLEHGTLVTLSTPSFLAPLAGVVTVPPRPIPQLDGLIPCEFKDADAKQPGVQVTRILDEVRGYRMRPPAVQLRRGDTVTAIEGVPVRSMAEYKQLMFGQTHIAGRPLASGEPVRVSYIRDGAPAECTVTLEFAKTPSGQLVRPASTRYSSFPAAAAIDIPTRPEHCGAPILDADGHLAGILIARAPFIESLVLPVDEVTKALQGMKFDHLQSETKPR